MAKVLVVDDDESLRGMLVHALRSQTHEVHEASDGREALHRYNLLEFDLIITDIIMPDIEGMEFIRRIKKSNRDVPIIAISGGGYHLTSDFLQKISVDLGASAFLTKPFDLERLSRLVRELTASPNHSSGQVVT